jgi:hypothetical protein
MDRKKLVQIEKVPPCLLDLVAGGVDLYPAMYELRNCSSPLISLINFVLLFMH